MQRRLHTSETFGDVFGGLAFAVLGIVWALTSIGYGLTADARLAPGTVPFIAGGLLAVCGLTLAAKGIVASVRSDEPLLQLVASGDETATSSAAGPAASSPGAADAPRPTPVAQRLQSAVLHRPVLSVYLIVVAAMLIMPLTGFALAFAIAIFTIMRWVEQQRLLLSTVVAVATALAGYLLFEVVFRLPLPTPFFL